MGDVEQVVFAVLLAIGILFIARTFLQAGRRLREFFDDPNKITPPGKAVYSDLREGTYYIFVLSRYAFTRFVRRMMPNLDLIDGMEFRVRNLNDDREIELEEFTGRNCVRFGNKRSKKGIYSVRKFRLDWGGDVELEVSGGRSEDNDCKVFISSSKLPGAGLVFGTVGRVFLVILVLGALHIVIMNILERLGIVVR
jgi:hypothetical protein